MRKAPSRRTWMASAARVLALVALGAGVLWLATFGSFEERVSNPMVIIPRGYPLPAFRLPVLNAGLFRGDTTWMSSDSLRGHVLLMNTWASWCGPCKAEIPDLMTVAREFAPEGVRLVGVLFRDEPRTAYDWLARERRASFTTLADGADFVRRERAGALPTTLLVDRSGRVIETYIGSFWPERLAVLKKQIRAALASRGSGS